MIDPALATTKTGTRRKRLRKSHQTAGRSVFNRHLRCESLEKRLLLSVGYPDFSDATGLNLLGRAATVEDDVGRDVLRLTPSEQGPTGGAWYEQQQFVSVDFETTFDLRMSEGSNEPDGTDGSDGMAFVIQNHGPNALGGGGGSLAYNGMLNSLVIEYDTFQNSERSDPSHSHISIHTGGSGANSVDESYSIGVYDTIAEAGFILDDAQVHQVTVAYTGSTETLTVELDDLGTIITASINIAETLDLNSGQAWVGFVAATGGGWQNHDVLNWQFDSLADTEPVVAIGHIAQAEGDSGQTSFDFPITVARPDTTGPLSVEVDYATADGTATTADGDYDSTTGTLTVNLADGEAEATETISVLVNGDGVEEEFEDFAVSLSNAVGGVIAVSHGVGTILNDDTSISIDDATATEGDDTPGFIDSLVSTGRGGLYQPRGMTLGPDGQLYVGARGPAQVLRYDAESGLFSDVFADASELTTSQVIAEVLFGPDGHLYVSTGTNIVLKFDGVSGESMGEYVTPALGGLGGAWGMAFGPDGDLYIGSAVTEEVLRYQGPLAADPGAFVDVFASGNGLVDPFALTFGPDDNLYAASSGTNEVLRYQGPKSTSPGTFIDTFVQAGSGGLAAPRGLAFHDDGNLYVVSRESDQVLRYDATTGVFIDAYADIGLNAPMTALFDSDGNLLVSNRDSHDVSRFGPVSQAVFTVSLSSAVGTDITVDYYTEEVTATAGIDYNDDYEGVPSLQALTIPAGETTKSIIVPTNNDSDVESTDETFYVNLINPPTGAEITDPQGVGTIREDLPRLSVNDVVQAEGDDDTTSFTFTVTLAGDTSSSVSVDWATLDGSATEDVDYTGVDDTLLTFPVGATEREAIVTVNGDTKSEVDEYFEIVLSNEVGAALEDPQGTGTILNDDWHFSVNDASATEGDESVRFFDTFVTAEAGGLVRNTLTFGPDGDLYAATWPKSVSRYDAMTGELKGVLVRPGSGGLNGPRDLVFGPGGYLYVASIGTDQVLRYDSTTGDFVDVFVSADSDVLDNPDGMTFGPDANEDGVEDLYVGGWVSNNVICYDGTTGDFIQEFVAAGETSLVSPFGLLFGPDGNLYVASGGSNEVLRYDGSSGALIDAFVPDTGGLSEPRDVEFGPDGYLYVTSGHTDEILRYDGVTGESVDTFVPAGTGGLDNPRALTFGSDYNLYVTGIGNNNEILRYGLSSQVAFTVDLSIASHATVTVDYDVISATAEPGSDYVTESGTVVFAPDETSKTILVATIDDDLPEPAETFLVGLSNPIGGFINDATGTGTILNDDGTLLSGVVYADVNGDGMHDGNEAGLEDWTVELQTTEVTVETFPSVDPDPDESEQLFGNAMALLGDDLVVGAPAWDVGAALLSGRAYLLDGDTGEVLQTFANPSSDTGEFFGFSVATLGENVLVGSPAEWGDHFGFITPGAVRLFDASDGSVIRTYSNPRLQDGGFGASLAVTGDDIVVGAPSDDTNGSWSGLAYVIDSTTGSVLHTLQSPAPGADYEFGTSVAATDTHVFVGESQWLADLDGKVHMFDAVTGDLVRTFSPPEGEGGEFGFALATDGNYLAVGAINADIGAADDAGAVYLFDIGNGDLVRTVLNPTPETEDFFGSSVAIVDDTLLVGTPGDNTTAANGGAAYLFDIPTGDLLETAFDPVPEDDDEFGHAIVADDSRMFVTAIWDNAAATDSGSVIKFEQSIAIATATTDSAGRYEFPDVAPGSVEIRQVSPSYYNQTEPGETAYSFDLNENDVHLDLDFGIDSDLPQDDIIGRVDSSGEWWVARSDGTKFTNEKWNQWSTNVTWEHVLSGDFNGDGKNDVVGRVGSSGDWYVARSTSNGAINEKWGTWSPNVTWRNVLVGDFNGDGRDDLAGQGGENGDWYVAKSTGDRFVNEKWGRWSPNVNWVTVQVGDFNGDGSSDLVGRVATSGDWWVTKSTGSAFSNAKWGRWSPNVDWLDIKVGDFNGDGDSDLVGRVGSSGDWYVAQSSGTSFANSKWGRWSPGVDWVDVSLGDFNGDGRDDLVGRVASSGDWWLAQSTGTAFVNAKWGSWSTAVGWVDVQVGDFNGDGKSDLAGRVSGSGEWWVAKSDGDRFVNESWGRWSTAVGWVDVQVGNFDGKVGSDGGDASEAGDAFWSQFGRDDLDIDLVNQPLLD